MLGSTLYASNSACIVVYVDARMWDRRSHPVVMLSRSAAISVVGRLVVGDGVLAQL